jgi:hypothetical protein
MRADMSDLLAWVDGQKDTQLHHVTTSLTFHVKQRSKGMILTSWEMGQETNVAFLLFCSLERKAPSPEEL